MSADILQLALAGSASRRRCPGCPPRIGRTWWLAGIVMVGRVSWQVDRAMAVPKNTVADPDGHKANLTFKIHDIDADGTVGARAEIPGEDFGVLVPPMVASGKTAQVTGRGSEAGKTYAFQTSGYDATGLYETEWSAYGNFRIRTRTVDIKLPAPNKDAPDPEHDATWQQVPGGQCYEQQTSRHRQPRRAPASVS
ncbi:hypothetical protein [Streptomyces sp. NPDC005930]|uniref:hypothetical protein n=1 Tax=Streptomyces sp. NPDC005930 TaxID=3364736 RepID=UPI0036886761